MRKRYSLGLFALFITTCSQLNAKSGVEVRLNQLGYKPSAEKVAIVPLEDGKQLKAFSVIDAQNGNTVLAGVLGPRKKWPYSGETVQQADFSKLITLGEYHLKVDGLADSYPFSIKPSVFDEVHKASIKAYYFNRASAAIEAKYGGQYARAAGHPDTSVKVHASAASEQRPIGTELASPKGWYDAGDYGKYIVNSGISTYTLLTAYQHHNQLYRNVKLSIPESNNDVPDLIDEIRWNLDWMETMQDLDGGVYHKLTTLRFSSDDSTPASGKKQRFVIGKSVTAALNFSAVMAKASRVMIEFDKQAAERYKQKAITAYAWAVANPDAIYRQPEDVNTGAYANEETDDEFAWAAAELFLLTKERNYFDNFLARKIDATQNLSWPSVGVLAYISLVNSAEKLVTQKEFDQLKQQILHAADKHLSVFNNSAYGVSASTPDFVWGSNGDVLNNGIVLSQAYRLTGERKYHVAAMSTLDYVLGKNATGYSFVTGYGSKTPMFIHHRPSVSDDVANPVPGFLAGGPHTGKQDGCDYAGDKPATTYSDTVCSYSTNEVAINWNAPLVYMLAAAISAD